MAYQIKSIRYQNNSRKILLQNIHGPCPLLATANALLLRGVITLSSECILNGVCSTDDVVTMLANRALLRYNTSDAADNNNSSNKEDSPSKSNHEYHLNEVLSILPSLQHGMDVNPKFTSDLLHSNNCVEYTKNLSAFDILGVTLVHGWLLDPIHDVEAYSIIGTKSYNELIELVILGNELRNDDVPLNLEKEMQIKIDEREKLLMSMSVDNNTDDDAGENCENDEVKSDAHDKEQTEPEENNDIDDNAERSSIDDQKQTIIQQQQLAEIETEIADLRNKLEETSLQISRADVVNAFLTSTSHQLTYHGLEQLHKHVGDDALHVFFRNNHFATLTKHDGGLYLLVTDLGYANTPEIVWEKLDSIDGNTEYVNEYFERPSPRTELIPASGPTIDPALLLAQRSQTETDYQLAMAISRGDTSASSSHNNTDDEEGKLIEAAKELSLRTYHGETDATVTVTVTENSNTNDAQQEKGNSQMESDHQIALAYQRQEEQLDHESERLARQLQELDRQELQLQQQRNRTRRQGGAPAPARRQRAEETKSGCIIS
jgi:hypothetical protein